MTSERREEQTPEPGSEQTDRLSERLQPDAGLVTLYAERLQHRSRVVARPRHSRPAPALHQFGRAPRPNVRRRAARAHLSVPVPAPVSRGATMTALVATALVAGTQATAAATTHAVLPGDTLSGIADQYDVAVETIAALNGITNPDLIFAGSVLAIDGVPPLTASAAPDAPAPTSTTQAPGLKQHHVLAGESLSLIADRYGVTIEALMEANGLTDPDLLEVDTVLVIPAVGANSTKPASVAGGAGGLVLHFVAEGETLGEIATRYRVTYQALAAANSLDDPNRIEAGQILRIPGAGVAQQGEAVKLRGMPVAQQSLPLSCEATAVSIATAYWGNQVSEWIFIENLPSSPDPHYGFRGSMTGAFGGTTDYGVYAEPFVPLLERYGFVGDVFYADGDADLLKEQINAGRPVVAWMTNMATAQPKTYAWHNGSRFALVPQEHAVVVYGYDDELVYVVDPGDGAFRQFTWDDFMRSWGYFDGMSLAVYPSA